MRPAFLDQHAWWTVTRRESLTRAEYASPVTRYEHEPRWERIAGKVLAVAIGVGLAAYLVAWWSA